MSKCTKAWAQGKATSERRETLTGGPYVLDKSNRTYPENEVTHQPLQLLWLPTVGM